MPIDGRSHNSPAADEGQNLDSSNKTVKSQYEALGKRKRTDYQGDGAAASTRIPWQLHLMILDALELRQDMMLNKRQGVLKNDSHLELMNREAWIRYLTKLFKKLNQLPHDWKYNPATASTYVSAEVDISTPKHERAVLLDKGLLELQEALTGQNFTDSESESASEDMSDSQSELASEDKNDSEPDTLNKHYVKNLLKDKNVTQNDNDSERGVSCVTCLSTLNGSNSTAESPSVDFGERKRTDEGDGDATSTITPRGLHLLMQTAYKIRKSMMQTELQRKIKKAWKGKNCSDSVSASEHRKDRAAQLDSYRAAQLDKCEDSIRSLVKVLKKWKQLPHDWEYDPDTASSFVFAEADMSVLPRIPPPKEIGAVMLNEINREIMKAVKGKNYAQLTKHLEYKNDSESERELDSINASTKTVELPSEGLGKRKRTEERDGAVMLSEINREVKKPVKGKNYAQLTKHLEYKNDGESERELDSINGSTSTVESPSVVLGKRKRTDKGDGAAASKIIPPELHLLIQRALKLRDVVILHKLEHEVKRAFKDENDSESESYGHTFLPRQLVQLEDRIRSDVKMFKEEKELPRDWEYDPATASTFVAAAEGTSALPKIKIIPLRKKKWGCCSWVIDPNQKFPKTDNVPLDEEEKKIWMDFKEFNKDKPGLSRISYRTLHEHEVPLLVGNPIVGLTSKFAVTAFNEAIEMYVKKGELNNIHDFDVVECKYLKLKGTGYYFYIIIEAFEERVRGVYDTKVKLNWDDGSKSLLHFVLTDRKPLVLKEATKQETHPAGWKECSGIPHSGMRRRLNTSSICRGYDYRTPWSHGGP